MDYWSLVNNAKTGNFKDTINTLKHCHSVLEVRQYINLVACACQGLSNASSNFTGQELVELLKLCLANMGTLGETELRRFLNSTLYILRHMLNQNEVELIHQNPDIWNPPFLRDYQNDALDILHNHGICIYHKIISLSKSKTNNDYDIEKLCMLLIGLVDRLPIADYLTPKTLFSLLKHLFYCVQPVYIELVYKYQLRKICNSQVIRTSELSFLLDGLHIITLNFTKKEEHKRAACLIQSVTEELKNKFSGDIYNFLHALELMKELLIKKTLQPEKVLTKLNAIHALFKEVKVTLTEISEIYNIFQVILIEFYNSNKTQMNSNIMLSLSEILLYLSRKANTKYTGGDRCPNCTKCGFTRDFRTNISFLRLIMKIFRDIASKSEMTDRFLVIIEETYTIMFNLIDEFRGGCESWTRYWCDAMTNLHNAAVVLYRLKTHQKGIIWVGHLFLQQYLAQCNKKALKSLTSNLLHSLLSTLTSCFGQTEQLQDALTYCALNVYMCNKKSTEECYCTRQWFEIKAVNQSYKNVTMVRVLSDELFWRQIDENFKFTKEDKLALLNVELQVYQKLWPSKIPKATCCLEIHEFGLLPSVQALIYAWGLEKNIPSELNKIISESRKEYESMILTVEQKLDLAVLYLLEYRTKIITATTNIKNNIANEPHVPTKSQHYLDAQEVQYNKLDCVSNYEELYLINHMKIIMLLLKSLKIYKNALPNIKRDLVIKKNVYSLLMTITSEMQFQGHSTYFLEGMLLCKKVAEIVDDNISIVETIGYVLEISDINSDDFKALLRRAEDIIETISGIGELDDRAKSTIVIYYVHKALAFLRYGFIETAIKLHNKASQLHRNIGVSNIIASVKLRLLAYNLKMLPCQSSIENHFEDLLSEPSVMIENLDADKSSCKDALHLNIVSSLVHYYRWTDQVRDLRCLGKTALDLAKSHVLPVRTSEIFGYLISADLMSERWDDYEVKLNGLSAILNVSTEDRPVRKVLTPIDNNICTLVQNFEEMALDVPESIHHQRDCGSPILSSSSFYMPNFLYHDNDCLCFPCMSVEYQNLILIEVMSKGNLWAFRDNTLAADQFFKGGIQIYKTIVSKQDIYKKKVINNIELDLFPDLKDVFADTYANLLYDYCQILIGTHRFSFFNDELICILENNRYRNIHLYLKAMSQKISHLSLNQITKVSSRLNVPSTTKTIRSRSKTPENHISTVSIAVSISPKPKIKRVIPKGIKFDLSDNEESNERKRSSNTSPLFSVPKTPAPTSTIRVYEPRTVKPVIKSLASSVSKTRLTSDKVQRKKEDKQPVPNDERSSSKRVAKKSAAESGSSRAGSISPKPRTKRVVAKGIKVDQSGNEESNVRRKSSNTSPLFDVPKMPAATSEIRVYEPKTVKPVIKSLASTVSKTRLTSDKVQRKKEEEQPVPNGESSSSKCVAKKSASESGSSRAGSISPKPKAKRVIAKGIKVDLFDDEESNERKKSSNTSPLLNIPKTAGRMGTIKVYKPKTLTSVRVQAKREEQQPVPIVITSPDDEGSNSKRVTKVTASDSSSSSSVGAIRRSTRPKK